MSIVNAKQFLCKTPQLVLGCVKLEMKAKYHIYNTGECTNPCSPHELFTVSPSPYIESPQRQYCGFYHNQCLGPSMVYDAF